MDARGSLCHKECIVPSLPHRLMASNSPQPHSLFTAGELSPHQHGTHQGQTLNRLNKPGWDFLEIVDNQYVCHLPSRPQPVMVTRLSPPKMYPQKMF